LKKNPHILKNNLLAADKFLVFILLEKKLQEKKDIALFIRSMSTCEKVKKKEGKKEKHLLYIFKTKKQKNLAPFRKVVF